MQKTHFTCQTCGYKTIVLGEQKKVYCPYCNKEIDTFFTEDANIESNRRIPFAISKEQAMDIYRVKYSSKMIRSVFQREEHIRQIHKVYVPYCLCNANVIIKGSESVLKKEYQKIPVNASLRPLPINNTVCESFNLDKLTTFKEQEVEDCEFEKQLIISSPIKHRFREWAEGYVSNENQDIEIDDMNITEYVYLPFWILITNYMDEFYYFVMNGQTGNVYYTLTSKNAMAASFIFGLSGASIIPIYWFFSHILLH